MKKLSKNLPAKYYQDKKKKHYKKKLVKVFLKKKNQKSNNMFVNDTKISAKMKNKSWLNIKKCYEI